jgi:hypothetical protein
MSDTIPPRRSVGRPSRYREDYPDQAYRLALLGLTDEEMAQFFGVDGATLYRWDSAHPEFREARARGKIPADAKVAEKLYHRAIGYEHDAVKIFMPSGAEEPVYAPYIERFAPETNAAALWLSNRQGGKWKLKSTSEVSGPNGGPIQVEDARKPIGDLIAGTLPSSAKPDVG